MSHSLPTWLEAHPDVAAALMADKPVVALESTVITHGLPRPVNLELARHMQSEVASAGAQPATIALLGGTIHVGLTHEALEKSMEVRGKLKDAKKKVSNTCQWGAKRMKLTKRTDMHWEYNPHVQAFMGWEKGKRGTK